MTPTSNSPEALVERLRRSHGKGDLHLEAAAQITALSKRLAVAREALVYIADPNERHSVRAREAATAAIAALTDADQAPDGAE